MKKFLTATIALLLVLTVAMLVVPQPAMHAAAVSGEQVLLKLRFVDGGVQAKGANVLQVGSASTLSAAVASATLTEVVAAPSSGSTVITGVLVEKSGGGTGTYTIKYGTGTNCGTGTTTILGPVTNPVIGFQGTGGIVVPATKAVCISTDGASTGARLLTQ